MTSDSPFLAEYQSKLDALKTMCETRLNAAKGPGVKVFSPHVSESDALAVLLDRDLMLIQMGTHPMGEDALLEVAHRSILLHLARKREQAIRAQRLQMEKEILDTLMQKTKEDIHAGEDRRVFQDLDQAQVHAEPANKSRQKAPKGRTPKRKGRTLKSKGRGKT